MNRTKNYWTDYPITYRTEQIATIISWITAGESGVVVGGSGTGKSNLAGFLTSQPEAINPFVRDNPDRYLFLHLDINGLPMLTVPFFYRGLVQTLQDAAERLDPEIQQAMQQLTAGQINWDDVFQVLTLLQKAYRLVIYQAGLKVIWLLDRFDAACVKLDAQTLSSLRSLRDQFKGQLCYVVFTRHPLARLRDPGEIDEFHEIVAANTCRVGPMVERDALWVTQQMAERLNTSFNQTEVEQLLAVTGGLPAFLKLGCLALAEGAVSRDQSRAEWTERLLDRPEFKRNCQEIWDDLLPEEATALVALVSGADERQVDQATVNYLERAKLLTRFSPEAKLRIFSPIFERFIYRQQGGAAGVLELHPRTRSVLRDGIPLEIELTPYEDRLLSFFLEHPGELCHKDSLVSSIWVDDEVYEGIQDDRLAQLIRRLRQKIEPDANKPTYIQTVRGHGYRFVQPE
ncbi:MAG: winged helix-turn-helix transcriptional regulator [Anaerolineae bacterium]|nr:winged helix-turn-helix transcriptional regulator [Anaerolineae bacterium]